jgi:hypothetical protein
MRGLLRFFADCRSLGPRVALCVFPFAAWNDWAWFLVASPLLRWTFGPAENERWWQGWFAWPVGPRLPSLPHD